MQVQRVQNNKYNTQFGAKVSPETILSLRYTMSEISRGRFDARLENMFSWGQEDSVIKHCISGINKDRFVLTNPRLGAEEIPITEPTKNKGLVTTFFDDISENKIIKAEEFLTALGKDGLSKSLQAIKKEADVLRKAGYENVSEQINKIIDNIISK